MRIVDGLKLAGLGVVLGVGAVVGVALAPMVSLVAVPIFALKALPKWIEHGTLYNRTLTDGRRAKYGRIEGQDYTRWDGKAVSQVKSNPTPQDRMHELINKYVHGQKKSPCKLTVSQQALDCPFKTGNDLTWLKSEFTRREIKDLLDSDLKMLRAFSKALIPLAGVFWVLYSETGMGGASQIGCSVCMTGGKASESHWGWQKAINFHKQALSTILGKR